IHDPVSLPFPERKGLVILADGRYFMVEIDTRQAFHPRDQRMLPPFFRTGAARPLPLLRRGRLPTNRPLPQVYRFPEEPREEPVGGGDARAPKVARVEALRRIADEPLAPRKLARAAGLADGVEARQVVQQLQELYDRDRSAFQVAEIAGGFQ